MNSGDLFKQEFNEELLDGFRISECQTQGNESAFKNLLNQVREHNKQLNKQIDYPIEGSQHASSSTQFTASRSSFSNNGENLQSQIEIETIKQTQLQNVIHTQLRKITDYKKHTDSVLELLSAFTRDDTTAKQENTQSNQLLLMSKKNASQASEYLQLLTNAQTLQKQRLIDKHQVLQLEIKQLQTEYNEYRAKQQQKIEIIEKQKEIIQELDNKKSKIHLKKLEQQTVIYYANTFKLLEEMFNKEDPKQLFKYQFEQRQQIIQQQNKKSVHSIQQIQCMFATQIEVNEQEIIIESPKEKETDQKLLDLIKNENVQLNDLSIQQELLSFADSIIQKFQEFRELFDRLGFQFIQLNEKKYELEQAMRETTYYKYPETSNGLLALKLKDNFNNNSITLNILSTSVELDLNEQRYEQEVKRIQNAVIRLFNFLKNHSSRTNHLVKHIHELSELVPESVFTILEQLKNSIYVNEIIRTPSQKKPSILASSILDQKQEFAHVKHTKLLSQKQMLHTMHIPKRPTHSSVTKFKYLQIVQKFIKGLLQDEIERLFIQQDMIDELIKEVQKYCEETDPDEEALMRYLGTKKMFFSHHLQQRTRGMLKNSLSKLGEVLLKLRYESQQLQSKGLQLVDTKYRSGCPFNNKELASCQRTCSNHFVSSQQSFDNVSINQSDHNKPGKDVFHFLKKLTNDDKLIQQESEDVKVIQNQSIDKERDKLKKQQYFVKNQVKHNSQKNLDDDVFYRLNPQRINPNKEMRNQLDILRQMRIKAARSSCSIDQEVKKDIWKMTCPVKPRKDTFRKLFNSSEKKLQTDTKQAKKIQTRSFQATQIPRIGDDPESIWKKKYRAKRVLNAISLKQSQQERFGFLEVI